MFQSTSQVKRILLILISLLFFFINLNAQNPIFEWANGMGSTATDFGQAVAIDPSGNVISVGLFQNTIDLDPGIGTDNYTSLGSFDGYVSKVDVDGIHQWGFSLGGTGADGVNGVAVDALGNIYITGLFTGTIDLDPTAGIFNITSFSVYSVDAFWAKYDTNGNLLNAYSWGGAGYDQGNDIKVSTIGEVYIIGDFEQTVDFDPSAGTVSKSSNGGHDVFIARYNSSYLLNFIVTIGSSETSIFTDHGSGIDIDPSGNVYVSGFFTGAINMNPNGVATNISSSNNSFSDGFIAKYSSGGILAWAKALGANNSDKANDCSVDDNGNMYVTGEFNYSVDFNPGGTASFLSSNFNGNSNIFISKYTTSGDYEWAFGFGSNGSRDAGRTIESTGEAIFVAGNFRGTNVSLNPIGGNTVTSTGGNNGFIASYDFSGNHIWSGALNTTGLCEIYGIASSTSNDIAITGKFSGTTDFDTEGAVTELTYIGSAGTYDSFVAKYRSLSTVTDFNTFNLTEQSGLATIDAINHTISVEVFLGTDVTSLAPTFVLSEGATVKVGGITQSSGVTVNNFTNPQTYTVTAEDGITTQDWIISVITPPSISSFVPTNGPVGTSVTIMGTNFDTTPSNNIVFFGATQATVSNASATELTVIVPMGATYMPITVLVNGLTAYSFAPFEVTYNGADINFDTKVDFSTNTNPHSLAIGDLDGDGKSDLVTVNQNATNMSVFRNTSISPVLMSYATKVDYPSGASPYSVVIEDIDGDGKSDVIVANGSDNSVSVFRNTSIIGAISFASKVDITTGTQPYFISVGDLDLDGKVDLAVVNLADNSVSVLRNTGSIGSISFDTKIDLVTGSSPQSVSVGDLNGDGKPELIVSNGVSNTVSVFKNTNTGTGVMNFDFKVDYVTGLNPWGTAVGDLNSDGKADLIITNYGSNSVSVLKNISNGVGTINFDSKVDFVTETNPRSVSIGDLNGDGKPDLAVANASSNTVSVFKNIDIGDGSINYALKVDYPTEALPIFVAIGDLDNDRKVDLAVACYTSSLISIFKNLSAPIPPKITSFAPTSGPFGTEVIISGSNFDATPANNIVFFGATQATVSAASATELTVTVPLGATYEPITVLTNGLTASSSAPFIVNFTNGGGFALSESFIGSSDNIISIARKDLTGDGLIDLAIANYNGNTVSAIRNSSTAGSVNIGGSIIKTTKNNPRHVSLVDLDGDGKSDLLAASEAANGGISVFRNTSNGIGFLSFGTKIDIVSGANYKYVGAGDFDGDGKIDLVAGSYANAIDILRNTSLGEGDINFGSGIGLFIASSSYSIGIGDIDNDGKPDLVVAAYDIDKIAVFRNTSTGVGDISFATKVEYATGSNPYDISLSDFDNDEKIDIAVVNVGSNTVSVYKNNSTTGNISLNSKIDYSTGNSPSSIEVGDLNGDGKPDLAISSSPVSVLTNTNTTIGTISFAPKAEHLSGSGAPQSITLGDIDLDGKDDIILSKFGGGNAITVLRNSNTETDLLSFSFPEQTSAAVIDNLLKTINIEVAYGTDITTLVSTFTLSSGAAAKISATVQVSGTTENDFTNAVTYVVTAEDGSTTDNWIVNTAIAPNTETDITAFSLPEQSGTTAIDAVNKTISLAVVYGTDLTSLIPTFTLSSGASAQVGATLQVSATTANDFSGYVVYAIIAEDGIATQDWTVTVTIAPNTETDIISFSIPAETGSAVIDAVNYTISLQVPYATDVSALVSTFTLSAEATAKVGVISQVSGTTPNDFTNGVSYAITAGDGTTTQNWVVTVTIALSPATDILAFSFAEQTGPAVIDAVNHTVAIEVAYGTDISLIATFTLSSGATAIANSITQISGVNTNSFNTPVTYTVTPEDVSKPSQDWVVTVTTALNEETAFTDFLFPFNYHSNSAIIDVVNHTISVELDAYGTDITALIAGFTLSGGATAKVGTTSQVSGVTVNDFSSPVTYAILAEDGVTSQDWVITVTVAANTATDITAFSFPEQTMPANIDAPNRTVSVQVAYGTDVTALIASFTLSGGAVATVGSTEQISGTTPNDFTSYITYLITADDGVTFNNWTVMVDIKPNSETDILTFSVPNQVGESVINTFNRTVLIEMPYGSDVTSLVSTFSLSPDATAMVNGALQQSGISANNFIVPVTYAITAGDLVTVQYWTVTVVFSSVSTETDIAAFSLTEQAGIATIDAINKTVDIQVVYGTSLTNLIASFELSTGAVASINGTNQMSGITTNDFTNPLTYTITAEDGITIQNWTITVMVAKNSATDITAFSFAQQTGDAVIDTSNKYIAIEVATGTDVTTLVAGFTLSDGANASIGAVAQVSESTANNFTDDVTYTITAEDGITAQDWVVSVTVALNTATEITAFSFPEQTEDAVINSSNNTIEIQVAIDTDVTSLVASFTLSSGAVAEVNGTLQASGATSNDFSNSVTYTITAEDGVTTQDWTVTIILVTGLDDVRFNAQVGQVYPNPFNTKVSLPINIKENNATINITLIDLNGKRLFKEVIRSRNVGDFNYELKTNTLKSEMQSGTYILRIEIKTRVNTEVFTKKIIYQLD